ncbi:Co2+/Mg2+ efflux protein ApaG [Pleionea sediminis]|uniref:Co2+/Mg2+ efflux protein ApaG n=1 Tax=Pleionea sediminis TaxID=2569479 RepID=UPI001186D9BF|nr:Co2+/Mg2+ efflux protein ApaG [Pleionea sediminis]
MSPKSDILEFEIEVDCEYLEDQSKPDSDQFVFAYTVNITNTGEVGAQLLRRHWIITDANGKEQEVRGDGVIGEQPHIDPGETYQYTSGAILKTPLGTMEGSYQMQSDTGLEFDAPIPLFSLTKPGILH